MHNIMPNTPSQHRLPGDEQALRAALQEAELPPLLAALAHISGDISLLSDDLCPPLPPMAATIEPQGGMSAEAQHRARELILAKLLWLREHGPDARPASGMPMLERIIAFITGGASRNYLPLLEHELALESDPGAPKWSKAEIAPQREFSVVVIGAGASGLAAAHRLDQAGVPFVVIEKNSDVGGTWWENSYPGCRLDTPNYAYSFSFAQKEDWPEQFSRQQEIRDYFRGISSDMDIRRHVRFNIAVTAATYREEEGLWQLALRHADGKEEMLSCQAIISAVGQLNQPKYPDIPGRNQFTGTAVHSARWPDGLDLAAKRVAVIGAGASAYQIVPSIVDQVGALKVFQRNAPWMLPTPNYHEKIPDGMLQLFQEVPYYARWFRFWQFWIASEGRMPFVHADPDWHDAHSVSKENENLRRQLAARLQEQFADRPDLLAKATPDYPPGAKRMLRDNGVWAKALKRGHVELITDHIAKITEHGIATADGQEHDVDVIVYATGFHASDFLGTMAITGRGGITLEHYWNGDAKAYLGITIPHFPNLFCLYGPNTNLVVNGSILFMAECAIEYTMECLKVLLQQNVKALDCREQASQDFNDEIDAANARMAWGASNVSSWYKNEKGRVSQNWPHSLLHYWQLTRTPELSSYEFL
jgi:4-hydroxyacetophenone monooxygenase